MGELELLDKNEKQLRAKFPIRRIGIFGSVAKGTALPSSDIDILVEFEHPVDIFEFLDLKEHLEQLLGRKVDLVTQNALKPQLRERILKEVVYA